MSPLSRPVVWGHSCPFDCRRMPFRSDIVRSQQHHLKTPHSVEQLSARQGRRRRRRSRRRRFAGCTRREDSRCMFGYAYKGC